MPDGLFYMFSYHKLWPYGYFAKFLENVKLGKLESLRLYTDLIQHLIPPTLYMYSETDHTCDHIHAKWYSSCVVVGTSRVCRISFGEVISTWLYMWQHSPFAKKSESLLNTDTHHSHYIFIYSPVLDATTFVRSLSPLISPPSSPPYSVKSDECGVQQVQHHICVFVTRHTHARASLRRLHS